jgi:hypothetical protein
MLSTMCDNIVTKTTKDWRIILPEVDDFFTCYCRKRMGQKSWATALHFLAKKHGLDTLATKVQFYVM